MDLSGVHEIYDKEHNFLGVYIESYVWTSIKNEVEEVLKKKGIIKLEEYQEPIEDWELFKKCWDFKYPYDFSVRCTICGNFTDNWEEDKPKKFLLTAANISGLVSFRCLVCGSKVVKKHFKDKIVSECFPRKE